MVLGLKRRFQDFLELIDLPFKFLDTLLSFLLRLSEVDEFINGGFLASALKVLNSTDRSENMGKRTMFSSSICRLRRVFTVSRIESFILFLVVSKVLLRLLSSLRMEGQDGHNSNEYRSYSFSCNMGWCFFFKTFNFSWCWARSSFLLRYSTIASLYSTKGKMTSKRFF